MKYVDRALKGTYGYIKKQTRFEIVKTLILFAMAFGIFFIGLLTLHTKKSLWSVFAVLALLPACKSLVGLIMLLRFKSLSEEKYEQYKTAAGDTATLYENIITTHDKTFYVPVICVRGNNVFCYCADPSGKDVDLKAHMDNVFSAAQHKVTFKAFSDETAFLNRARQLKTEEAVTVAEAAVIETIKAVSL